MFESNSKFPRFFVYMMSSLALIIFVGMFFSVKFVAAVYLIGLVLAVILFILDQKYGSILTNYKVTYLLFELLNLIAIISIMYYEYSKHSEMLNLFLFLLIITEVLLVIIDFFVVKNKNLTKNRNLLIDFIKLCSMICILTYFFDVSKLYFAIFSFMFEAISLVVKVESVLDKPKDVIEKPKEEKLEDVIHSNDDNLGDDD